MKAETIAPILIRCVVVVIAVVVGYVAAIGAYQSFRLRCRPNCAGVDLSNVSLYRPYNLADPEMSILSIKMREVSFREANLSQADLRGVFVRKCDFGSTDLSNANLRDTDFAWANLAGADLSHAYMFKTNLYDASLTAADLSGADLTQAYMLEADLTGADLTRTKLTGAEYNGMTKWPEGFDPGRAGAVLIASEQGSVTVASPD